MTNVLKWQGVYAIIFVANGFIAFARKKNR